MSEGISSLHNSEMSLRSRIWLDAQGLLRNTVGTSATESRQDFHSHPQCWHIRDEWSYSFLGCLFWFSVNRNCGLIKVVIGTERDYEM